MNEYQIGKIVNNWVDIFNLDQKYEKLEQLALCLNAQYILNNKNNTGGTFSCASLPLILRIFKESKAFKNNNITNDLTKNFKIIKLKTKWLLFRCTNLEEYANYTCEISSKITKEFDKLFSKSKNKTIIFHGFNCLKDGTITIGLTFS